MKSERPNLDLKSLEEHRGFVRSMARISFWFAFHWRCEHPEDRIGQIVQGRTPLFLHALDLTTDRDESCPQWQTLLATAEDQVGRVDGPDDFEDVMFDHARGFLDERAEQSYPTSVGVQVSPAWNVGSLKYDPPRDGLPANYCNFHIANSVFPKSIFDDPAHLPACFVEMMDRGQEEYGYDTLHTTTWLNDRACWLALFPKEWHDNLSPRNGNIGWTFGHWGQLVTARGTFSEQAGRHVREHGALRYACRNSHCSFEAMRTHLSHLQAHERQP
jgi:hypothetical protein